LAWRQFEPAWHRTQDSISFFFEGSDDDEVDVIIHAIDQTSLISV
jgi:hypothetical protein